MTPEERERLIALRRGGVLIRLRAAAEMLAVARDEASQLGEWGEVPKAIERQANKALDLWKQALAIRPNP